MTQTRWCYGCGEDFDPTRPHKCTVEYFYLIPEHSDTLHVLEDQRNDGLLSLAALAALKFEEKMGERFFREGTYRLIRIWEAWETEEEHAQTFQITVTPFTDTCGNHGWTYAPEEFKENEEPVRR